MIIKIIPETKEEKERYEQKGVEEVEHNNVQEFMFFGNKFDDDEDLVDFHEWHGSYRYLMGSLNFFYELINDERKGGADSNNISLQLSSKKGSPMVKKGSVASQLKTVDTSKLQKNAGNNKNKIEDKINVSAEDLNNHFEPDTNGKEKFYNPHGLKILDK